MTNFANPYFLALIPIVAAIWSYFLFWKKRETKIQFSDLSIIAQYPKTLKAKLIRLPDYLILLGLILIIIAIARPRKDLGKILIEGEGIDIAMAIDVSSSMEAEDFSPNRLEAAKNQAVKFIEQRPADRISIVIFSGESMTISPLTLDKDALGAMIKRIIPGMMEDGTAIGMGIASAVNRLKDSKAKSKIIVLLTDGVNNAGIVSPLDAAGMAKAFGIKIYSIGIGSNGIAEIPVKTEFGIVKQKIKTEIDENLLRSIADTTGGKFYKAGDNSELSEIYKEINKLEKTKFDSKSVNKYEELFFAYALLGAICIITSEFIKIFYFKRI